MSKQTTQTLEKNSSKLIPSPSESVGGIMLASVCLSVCLSAAQYCVYTRIHVAGYKLYPLVAVNMFLVSATKLSLSKLSPVCRPSVAGYKEIQVDRE